jgi:hypothetical protein
MINAVIYNIKPVGVVLATDPSANWIFACRKRAIISLNNGIDIQSQVRSMLVMGAKSRVKCEIATQKHPIISRKAWMSAHVC